MGIRQQKAEAAARAEIERLELRAEVDIRLEENRWEYYANCLGESLESFFPSDARRVEAARKICSMCVVKEECLEYALNNREDHGVWGGMSERQRRRILKQRRLV
ncbi:WhiB family transcriptional regulator [Candidatus Saccharibacteria bacterium]|nr:WhiB family transcriptional regulator [Candidatus Saccharibacteria bacterium]